MGLASRYIATGELIEYQSHGTVAALTANALSCGIAATDFEIVAMTAAAMQAKRHADREAYKQACANTRKQECLELDAVCSQIAPGPVADALALLRKQVGV